MKQGESHLMRRIRGRLQKVAGRVLGWLGYPLGYDTLRRDYYSPIPNLRQLPESSWDEASLLGGVKLDLDRQITFLENELAPLISEFNPPLDPAGDSSSFFLRNGTYGSVDAETLYAMIRHLRPKQVIELGSGRSTQVISAARTRNDSDGAPSGYYVADPFPTPLTRKIAPGLFQLETISATEVPLERFAELASGDVLFVDTTHTVKMGGEVNYIILDVLPTLAPGVVVHFHDIFLPWPYPRKWLTKSRRFWAEQYLLQAFLSFNSAYEPLLATQALSRDRPDQLKRAIPTFDRDVVSPGAFWIRRSS